MTNSIHKTWAPKCALPGCIERVGYHSKKRKEDGTFSYKWKTFCEYHRRDVCGKSAVDIFKKSKVGCESFKLGWNCPGNHGDMTVDHYDGNKHNNNEENLLILCHNCHTKKTKMFKDYQNRYTNGVVLNRDLFDWD